ncbi:hypothetical protein DAI22_11g096850 [Oryza sativa Japonica Group]|nr:hypothetical protein DAI22_11g096850 [Oryza sativa Japonica Group]
MGHIIAAALLGFAGLSLGPYAQHRGPIDSAITKGAHTPHRNPPQAPPPSSSSPSPSRSHDLAAAAGGGGSEHGAAGRVADSPRKACGVACLAEPPQEAAWCE